MFFWLHNYLPNPILFDLGLVKIHWYGLLIALAILSALLVSRYLLIKLGQPQDQAIDVGFYLIIGGILGARLYAVLLFLPYYLSHPLSIVAVWEGGLAIHGAIIGGILALLLYCHFKKQRFWLLADIAVVGLALAQAIGRFGNYFNQEIFGRPTDLPWGIPIALSNRPAGFESYTYFHPTFLYESVLNLINFGILFWLFKKILVNKPSGKQGIVALVYLINYSVIRILVETLRLDTVPMFWGIRVLTWQALGILVVTALILVFRTVGSGRVGGSE